jgi:phosphatidylglycerophosphate synthase
VTQPTGLLDKGLAAEEWTDLHFFRPLGLRLVQRLAPTRVTADQVTLASLLVGLAGGHLFLYADWRRNALGLLLLLVSDVLDSADGQLARLRGASTRLGAALDGLSDYARFLNLYIHLGIRILLAGSLSLPLVVLLAVLTGLSQSVQASIADFVRRLYLRIGVGQPAVELPEEIGPGTNLALAIYRGYLARLPRLFPHSVALLRGGMKPGQAWERRQAGNLAHTAWFAQNVRFALLAVTALPGWPAGFFWLTIGPLNLIAAIVLQRHERVAAELASAEPGSIAPDKAA